MSLLREDVIRPQQGGRVRMPDGTTATIITVVDQVIEGEIIPAAHVCSWPKTAKAPRFVVHFIDDPRTVEPPLQPGLLARRLLAWVAARRGTWTSDQDEALAAAALLAGATPAGAA